MRWVTTSTHQLRKRKCEKVFDVNTTVAPCKVHYYYARSTRRYLHDEKRRYSLAPLVDAKFPVTALRQWPDVRNLSAAAIILNELDV